MFTLSTQIKNKTLQVIMTFAIAAFSHNIFAIQILTENSPPYQFMDEGTLKGSSINAVKKILSCAKIDKPITLLPWKRAYQTALNQKDTLIFSMARTPEREHQFIWIAPIFSSTAYLFKLKSRDDIKINSMQDLNGFSIGSLPDDYKTKYLLSLPNIDHIKIHYFSQRRSQILMLANGRFDLTANDPETFMSMVEEFDLKHQDFEKLIPLGPPLTLFLAINKNSDVELIKTLQECGKYKPKNQIPLSIE